MEMEEMSFYDEFCVVLTAPAHLMRKFLRFCVYNLIYTRGIPIDGGYVYMIEDGLKLIVPMKAEITSFIDLMIQKVQACVDQKKACKLTVFIYDVETYRIIERWVIHPKPCGQRMKYIMSNIQSLILLIEEKINTLPPLKQPSYFLMGFQS